MQRKVTEGNEVVKRSRIKGKKKKVKGGIRNRRGKKNDRKK